MAYTVQIADEAATTIGEFQRWWTQHRPTSRPPFKEALASPLTSIAEFPNRFPRHPTRDLRYCRIEKTPYVLFFEVRTADRVVTVVTAWSTALGEAP